MRSAASMDAMRLLDPRLLRQAGSARGYLAVAVALGLAGAVLILAQADLLSRALAGAARGTGIAALSGVLAWLGVVVAGRAVAAAGGEAAALRAAAAVKSAAATPAQRPRPAAGPAVARRPASAGRSPRSPPGAWTGSIPTSPGTCRSLVLRCWSRWPCWPRWRSPTGSPAVIIAVTLPLIPLFAAPGRMAHAGADPAPVAAAGPARRPLPRRGGRACPP